MHHTGRGLRASNAPRRAVHTALLALLLCLPAFAQTDEIEIVESVPEETPLHDPALRNARDVWVGMIRGARATIAIEQFYVSDKPGSALEPVVKAIEDAAARGVHIRVIGDRKFHDTYPETLDRWAATRNMSCRILDFTRVAKGAVQHAKYFLIDDAEAFIGSQNFDWRSLSHIHEIGVRVRQKDVVQAFRQVFEMDWSLAGSNDTAAARGAANAPPLPFPARVAFRDPTGHGDPEMVGITPVCSPRGYIPDALDWDGNALVRLIDTAKYNVTLQVLSYSGGEDFMLDQALRRADARGVAVRVLVSDWSLGKNRLPSLRALEALPHTEVRFTSIPAHSSGFISFARVEHCKYLVVDGARSWIGSNNWSKDYFFASRNLGMVVSGGKFADRLNAIFARSWDGPYAHRLDPDKQYTPPRTDDGSTR
jgi:phosphatidylserine/phosphatidylglycerophosphate/cardiolipin synthase-like enzyme